MKILFHSNQLSLRGTEVALYDYAHFNETILNNKSLIAVKKNAAHHPLAVEKFKQRFPVFFYDSLEELQKYVEEQQVQTFYAIKSGEFDGVLLKNVKNCIHAVFKHYEPHGEVYAYVSKWLSNYMSNGAMPFVPHIVDLPATYGNLRQELAIPESALVFGRYGGAETFDIKFAHRVIYKVAARHENIYFLFMNTKDFIHSGDYFKHLRYNKFLSSLLFPRKKFANIIFCQGSAVASDKVKFIQTCDAMLHARYQGETFGIACGEFSILNKPVITCNGNYVVERSHIDILGTKGIYYASEKQLIQHLTNFNPQLQSNWNAYSADFNPHAVMAKFKQVFLD